MEANRAVRELQGSEAKGSTTLVDLEFESIASVWRWTDITSRLVRHGCIRSLFSVLQCIFLPRHLITKPKNMVNLGGILILPEVRKASCLQELSCPGKADLKRADPNQSREENLQEDKPTKVGMEANSTRKNSTTIFGMERHGMVPW